MRLEALAKAPEAFASTFESESVHPLEWFAERLAANAIFGAFQDTALVGIAAFFVHVAPKVAHKGTLWGMYVQPQARRTGIGRGPGRGGREPCAEPCGADPADGRRRQRGRTVPVQQSGGRRVRTRSAGAEAGRPLS